MFKQGKRIGDVFDIHAGVVNNRSGATQTVGTVMVLDFGRQEAETLNADTGSNASCFANAILANADLEYRSRACVQLDQSVADNARANVAFAGIVVAKVGVPDTNGLAAGSQLQIDGSTTGRFIVAGSANNIIWAELVEPIANGLAAGTYLRRVRLRTEWAQRSN